jgi:Helicase conserved C-terminal domain./SNF2 family N-terminal domain.
LTLLKRLYGDGNVWRRFDQVITSIDSVKPLEKRQRWTEEDIEKYNKERIEDLANAGWDIIIVDEAHRIAGSTSDVARYKLGKVLADASPYLLLLTATPHQGKTDSFLRLVRLLDKNAFPDENAIVREQVAPYIVRTEKREALDSEGNPLFKNRITKIKNISWSARHSLQKELYEKVTEYVSKGYNLARREKKNYIGFLMVLMQRLVTSSTHAIKENLERRIEILKNSGTSSNNFDEDDFYEYDAQEALDELTKIKYQDIKKEQREVEDLLHLAERAESQYVDVKAETLLEDLDLLQMEHSEKPKVIIFTEFIATQEFLRNFLQEKGYSVAILNGTMSIEERNNAIDEFKKSADILVSTDAGGEGLNLQFCNVMINYDLPWNPMKIEQRIGRIDRIGQKRDVVVINYVLSDTIEFRVRQVLEEKLKIVFEQFGVDKMQDILDSVESEMDFTDLYMKSIENPDDIDFRVSEVENKIKENAEKINNIKGILKDEKELNIELIEKINNTPIKHWLKQMYINKKLSDGDKITMFIDDDFLSLNNKDLEDMVKNIPQYIYDGKIPVVSIDGVPNENGYWSLWEVGINGYNN